MGSQLRSGLVVVLAVLTLAVAGTVGFAVGRSGAGADQAVTLLPKDKETGEPAPTEPGEPDVAFAEIDIECSGDGGTFQLSTPGGQCVARLSESGNFVIGGDCKDGANSSSVDCLVNKKGACTKATGKGKCEKK